MGKYRLNPKANFFYDQLTGVKIIAGKGSVEIPETVVKRSKKIRAAIATGHIRQIFEEAAPEIQDNTSAADKQAEILAEALEKSRQQLLMVFEATPEAETSEIIEPLQSFLTQNYKVSLLKDMCKALEIELEPGDTKADLVEAIANTLYNELIEEDGE